MADKKPPQDGPVQTEPMGWVGGGHPDPPTQPPQQTPPTQTPPTQDSPPSSSSSSSSAPPVDPRIAQLESLFRSAYIQLWGEPPTENYIKAAAHQGMNVTEFVHRERMKDAWQFTKAYKDEAKGLFDLLRQMGAA